MERFRALLRERGRRSTPEHEAIAAALLSRRGHYLLEALVQDLRGRGVVASRGAIYRLLPLLVESGILQPVLFAKEGICYESVGVCPSCRTARADPAESAEPVPRGGAMNGAAQAAALIVPSTGAGAWRSRGSSSLAGQAAPLFLTNGIANEASLAGDALRGQ